jgi:hypothetical protein
MNVSEPTETDPINITHEIKKTVCDNITKIEAAGSCKIVIIYIPQRWDHFTGYNIDGESFDLHDYIKAFCVEKGIMSQLITYFPHIQNSLIPDLISPLFDPVGFF